MEIFARHCAHRCSHIQGAGFGKCYGPVGHAESFIIYISIPGMHRLTTNILDVSNVLQNTNSPIRLIFSVSPPPYYLEWLELFYPNVTLILDDGSFFLQCINVIQGTKPAVQQ